MKSTISEMKNTLGEVNEVGIAKLRYIAIETTQSETAKQWGKTCRIVWNNIKLIIHMQLDSLNEWTEKVIFKFDENHRPADLRIYTNPCKRTMKKITPKHNIIKLFKTVKLRK